MCVCVYKTLHFDIVTPGLGSGMCLKNPQDSDLSAQFGKSCLVFQAPFALLGYHTKPLSFCFSPGSKVVEGFLPEDEHREYQRMQNTAFSVGFKSQL